LAPPAGSQHLLRWAQGPLSVPYRSGTPAYRLESRTRKTYCHMPYNTKSYLSAQEGSKDVTCPVALYPASLLGRTPALPHVPRLYILPPCLVGLRRCHVSHSSESCLTAREGSDRLPRVPRHRTPPPCLGGLRCCHVSHGSL
jgi:hypothetical protein